MGSGEGTRERERESEREREIEAERKREREREAERLLACVAAEASSMYENFGVGFRFERANKC